MKIKLLLFLGLISMSLSELQAQDPILLEEDWILIEMIHLGEHYFPPSNSEVAFIPLNFGEPAAPHDMITHVCNAFVADASFVGDSQVTFFNMASTLVDCSLKENNIFEFHYFGFFFDSVDEPLEYIISIVDDPDGYGLSIYKPDGDVVHYLSSGLGVRANRLSEVFFYGNAQDVLYIYNPTSRNFQMSLFAADGKLIRRNEVINLLDVSALPAGIYFVQLSDESGSVIKRFVKQ